MEMNLGCTTRIFPISSSCLASAHRQRLRPLKQAAGCAKIDLLETKPNWESALQRDTKRLTVLKAMELNAWLILLNGLRSLQPEVAKFAET